MEARTGTWKESDQGQEVERKIDGEREGVIWLVVEWEGSSKVFHLVSNHKQNSAKSLGRSVV